MSEPLLFGIYRGVVVDNDDPEHRGRVVVLAPGALGDARSQWCEPTIPQRVYTPEIGDIVYVYFINGDATSPVYVSTPEVDAAIIKAGSITPDELSFDVAKTTDEHNFAQDSTGTPAAKAIGDTWWVTNMDNLRRRWSGTAWTDYLIGTKAIADNAINSAKLADSAVDTLAIQDLAVSTTKLADNSVTAAKLADNAVDTAAIQDGAVTAVKLADNTISNGKLGANSVSTSTIQDGAVTTSKLADGAVTTVKMANSAVTNAKLGSNAVGTSNIQNGAVTAAKLGGIDFGYTSVALDASGVGTISHTLGVAPTSVLVQSQNNNDFLIVTVTASTTTDFTITVVDNTGAAVNNKNRNFSWMVLS